MCEKLSTAAQNSDRHFEAGWINGGRGHLGQPTWIDFSTYLCFFDLVSRTPSFFEAFALAGADLDVFLEAWKPFVMDCFLGDWDNESEATTKAVDSHTLTIPTLNLALRGIPGNAFMEKAIHSTEYRAFLQVLRELREQQGVTQVELAQKLTKNGIGRSPSRSSASLSGARCALDIIQLRWFCQELGVSLSAFVERLERRLARKSQG